MGEAMLKLRIRELEQSLERRDARINELELAVQQREDELALRDKAIDSLIAEVERH